LINKNKIPAKLNTTTDKCRLLFFIKNFLIYIKNIILLFESRFLRFQKESSPPSKQHRKCLKDRLSIPDIGIVEIVPGEIFLGLQSICNIGGI
jgi:hypothetical protein